MELQTQYLILHRVHETEAVFDATLGDQSFDIAMKRDDGPPLGDVQQEFFSV